jgi:hypothetical protein
MASRKQLQKGVRISFVANDWRLPRFYDTFEGKDKDVWEIIDATVTLHNGIIDRVNHPDGKDNKKLTRAYYKQSQDRLYRRASTRDMANWNRY